MMKKIIIYTKDYCQYCERAKELLKSKGLYFSEVDLTYNSELRETLSLTHHWRSVPMIFINDSFIGGFTELRELDRLGQL